MIIINKGQNLSHEFIKGGKGSSSKQFANQNTEPDFDLVEPRAMLWRVMKDNAMGGVTKKSSPSLLVVQDTGLAFLAKVNLKVRLLCNPANQGFREMNIEIVDHKMPAQSREFCRNDSLDMGKKIDFRARSANVWGNDLARNNIVVKMKVAVPCRVYSNSAGFPPRPVPVVNLDGFVPGLGHRLTHRC